MPHSAAVITIELATGRSLEVLVTPAGCPLAAELLESPERESSREACDPLFKAMPMADFLTGYQQSREREKQMPDRNAEPSFLTDEELVRVSVEPTEATRDVDGYRYRVWQGVTASGTQVELLVLQAILPSQCPDLRAFKERLRRIVPAAEVFQ